MIRNVIRYYSSATTARALIKDVWNVTEERPALLYGWIKSVRSHKKVTFLDINDGSSPANLQVVLPVEDFPSTDLYYGSAIGIEGKLIPRLGKTPKVEFLGKKILLQTPCDPSTYPFANDRNYPSEFVRRFPHLRPRQKNVASMLRVRSKVEMLIHEYFQNNSYTHIHTPAITSSDCEGAGELFTVSASDKPGHINGFFGTTAHLTVSGQLHLEACSMGLGNVYTLSPAFRAEKSRPQTHLCEFHMLEVEMAFTRHLNDVKSTLESSLKYVFAEVLKSCEADLLTLFSSNESAQKHFDFLDKCASRRFLDVEYRDAIDIINRNQKHLKTGPITFGGDLNDEHEKFLTTYHDSPIFVTNFPSSIKPFYTLSNDDETSASFDLLFPNCGEMAGGTLREHRHDVLLRKLDMLSLVDQYKWYLELRQFGGVPHGGYGLGFDRLIKFILGITNIKDAVPFPRAPKLCVL